MKGEGLKPSPFIKIEGSPQMNCTPKVRHKTFGVQFILTHSFYLQYF